jgi:hypothetical protein
MTNGQSELMKSNSPAPRAPQGKNGGDIKALLAAVSFAATIGGWVLIAATAPADAQVAQATGTSGNTATRNNQPAISPTTQPPVLQNNPSRLQSAGVQTNPQTQTRRPAPVTRSRSSR